VSENNETGSGVSDVAISYIRTYVPIIWGTVIAFLVGRGIDIPALSDPALVAGVLVPACIGLWYAAGRFIEQRWPKIGRFMLGSKKTPHYTPPNADGSYTITAVEEVVPVDPDAALDEQFDTEGVPADDSELG
jgi:hypothetical protein